MFIECGSKDKKINHDALCSGITTNAIDFSVVVDFVNTFKIVAQKVFKRLKIQNVTNFHFLILHDFVTSC